MPEYRDVILLRAGASSDGAPIAGKVSLEHLMRSAVRLGHPLGSVVDRLTKLVPLGLELPASTIGPWRSRIPTWQDFIVLSPRLDGVVGLSGSVSPEHVREAAIAVEETEAQVVERLRTYASLFGLTIA